ncbi:MAG: GNAT family N-acetyltransferase [Candidatus Eremiobacteraeota bacterium]|nr:GNAT family N-acetyltransferase [Candidatus Eremiobacteraeota bacterium]
MDAPGYERHEATLADLETALALRAAMTLEIEKKNPDGAYPGWRDRFLTFFRTRMPVGEAAVFLARSGEKVVGLACVYKQQTHRTEIFLNKIAYITSVYVTPDRRRQGIATALTRACIDWARLAGCRMVRLGASDMGLPMYLGMGFRPSNVLEMRLTSD